MKDTLVTIIENDAKEILASINLSELNRKKVLITGASGLVGTYLAASVKAYVTSSKVHIELYAAMQSDPSDHLKKLLDFPGAKILRGDITDHEFLSKLPSCDYIIHAAGYGQPGKFMDDQVKTLKLNTFSTFCLFEKLLPNGKFLFMSTSEVYSGLTKPPHTENEIGTTNTTHPRACYIEAKRCGEAICNAFRAKGVDAKSARLSLAYGPGTKKGDSRAINNFIEKAINGKIELLDAGIASRTYCYVTDAVELMWHILLKGTEPIYNVGGKSKTTIRELAETIGSIAQAPVIAPKIEKTLAGAPPDVSLDMTKAEKEFDKKEYVPLEEGLRKTIEWQKALYE